MALLGCTPGVVPPPEPGVDSYIGSIRATVKTLPQSLAALTMKTLHDLYIIPLRGVLGMDALPANNGSLELPRFPGLRLPQGQGVGDGLRGKAAVRAPKPELAESWAGSFNYHIIL